jgi:hypothetical protein
MASAMVGSAMTSCQCSTGSWLPLLEREIVDVGLPELVIEGHGNIRGQGYYH